jgi:uncharacterized membrane protein YebE (DUF533 family)
MNPQKLLEQFLGPNVLSNLGGRHPVSSGVVNAPQAEKGSSIGDLINSAMGAMSGKSSGQGSAGFSVPGGAVGGFAAGGVLGLLLGQKKIRKLAGGALGYGGAAALGALAFRAYQNWQSGRQAVEAPAATAADAPAEGSRFAPATGADGKPFALALIRAMIAAANADGHIGPDEQKKIFEAANRGGLDSEDKAFVFDALQNPPSTGQIAALAANQEQAAELYFASRIAVDPDSAEEKAFLRDLARAMKLPDGLAAHLDAQVAQNLEV